MNNTINIRGHHLSIFKKSREKNKYIGFLLSSFVYGIRFAYREYRFISEGMDVEPIKVNITSDMDDICKLGCPYYNHCASNGADESSLGWRGKSMKKYWGFNPHLTDAVALRQYGFKVGDYIPLEKILG